MSKKLEGTHKARDLYISDLFKKSSSYAIKNYDKVLILSAKYGAIELDQEIKTYNLTLNTFTEQEKKKWAFTTYHQLEKHINSDDIVFWHCGVNYNKYIKRVIKNKQLFPLKGLPIGKQLQWYKKNT